MRYSVTGWRLQVAGLAAGNFWLLLWLTALCGVVRAAPGEFICGADYSHLQFFEDRGITYRHDGTVQDSLVILRDHGVNCVRLRLFTSSAAQAQADPYNCTNNLAYTLPLAVRVKNAGMRLLLDFHYSDTWADPGHQAKPAAWTNLTFAALVQEMRAYNSNVIAAFDAAGVLPDYVQVGNEITGGMLWPDGAVGGTNDTPAQWSKLGQLMKAAAAGIQDAAGDRMPKIIVHIDRGGSWSGTQWFFDKLLEQTVPFDMIGQSYYGWWHGSPDDLRFCLTNAASRYHKPIVVAETAFPWSHSTDLYGIPATTNGQVDYVVMLAQIVKGIPGGLGAGIIWWGTEYQRVNGVNTAGFEWKSFFGTGGNALPVLDVFGQLSAPVKLSIRDLNTNLNLSWPLSGAGTTLTTATSLVVSANWQPVTNAVSDSGAGFTTTLPKDAGQQFYRLQAE